MSTAADISQVLVEDLAVRDEEEERGEWVHPYVSTYCQHGEHGDCRLACKVCGAICLCPCHGD
jgi:hypothetical protein